MTGYISEPIDDTMREDELKRAFDLGYSEPVTPPLRSLAMNALIRERRRDHNINLALYHEYRRGQIASITDIESPDEL